MAKQFALIEMTASDPFERGVQYGEQAKEAIDMCVNHYKEEFTQNGQSWETIKRFSVQFVDAIRRQAPRALEEAKGIAAGSGKSLEEIMVVNCRYEISKFPKVPECTTAAILPPAGRDGKMYVIKNWDYDDRIAGHVVLLKIKNDDGYSAFGITEAGQMVRDGLNCHGVSFVNNNLQSTMDTPSIGLPNTFMRKKIWEAKTFEEACEITTTDGRSVSLNTLVGHSSGKALNFEVYPGGANTLEPKNNILTHANHFVKTPEIDFFVNSPKNRDSRLYELLDRKNGDITVEYIMECMKDHEYHPLSICSHSHEDSNGKWKHRSTVAGVIMNLSDNEIHVCVEHPCTNEYVKYSL